MEIKKPSFNDKVIPEKIKDASYYYSRGIIAYYSAKFEEAEKEFNQAISYESNNSIAYFNRGTFYLNDKKYKPAIDDFQKAIRLRGNFAEAYYNLACAYVHILSFRESLANLKKAISLNKQFGLMAANDKDFRSIKNKKEFKDITLVYVPEKP